MITRWDIITIGNLSRNRYWGEAEDQAVRPALCTSTLIRSEDVSLLVDPPIADADKMATELDRRTGLKPEDIHAVFITHGHGDHWAGLANFASADWYSMPEVAKALNQTGKLPKTVQAVQGELLQMVEIIATPGHTVDHHSIRFDCEGFSVVVAGDAVMTRDFWIDRMGYHNSVDFEQVKKTMDVLSEQADIIVPGHDNWFLVKP